jgi:hypothetical protein
LVANAGTGHEVVLGQRALRSQEVHAGVVHIVNSATDDLNVRRVNGCDAARFGIFDAKILDSDEIGPHGHERLVVSRG